MHIKYLFLPLLLTYCSQTYPVICQATVLKHEQKNKIVLLLGDFHAQVGGCVIAEYMKVIGCSDQTIEMFTEVGQLQQTILSDFITKLLNSGCKHTCVITETNPSTGGALFEQEAGFIEKNIPDKEILCFIARLLMQDLMKGDGTPEQKAEFFNSNITTPKIQKYLTGCASLVLNKNLVWIIGDTLRTDYDTVLAVVIYQYRTAIIEALKQQDPDFPAGIKELTIGSVKEYVASLRALFDNNGFNDVYGQSITDIVNDIASKSGLSDTDHFAQLYQYLVDNNATHDMDSLNNKLIAFVSQKLDLDLQSHLEAVTESGDECDQAIVVAGAVHTQLLRAYLLTQGYTIIHQSGVDQIDDSDIMQPSSCQQIVQQAATLTNNFDAVVQSVLS